MLVKEVEYEKSILCITSILIILSITACGSQGTDSHGDKSETSGILQLDSENTEAQKTSSENSGKKH